MSYFTAPHHSETLLSSSLELLNLLEWPTSPSLLIAFCPNRLHCKLLSTSCFFPHLETFGRSYHANINSWSLDWTFSVSHPWLKKTLTGSGTAGHSWSIQTSMENESLAMWRSMCCVSFTFLIAEKEGSPVSKANFT